MVGDRRKPSLDSETSIMMGDSIINRPNSSCNAAAHQKYVNNQLLAADGFLLQEQKPNYAQKVHSLFPPRDNNFLSKRRLGSTGTPILDTYTPCSGSSSVYGIESGSQN